MSEILLEANQLRKYFKIKNKGFLHAVDGVSFQVNQGETLGLVGESGCGKSTVGNLIMRLLDVDSGEILYHNENILAGKKSRALCRKMQIIFQDPYSSLNPRKTIKQILSEPYQVQGLCRGREMEHAIQLLCENTGISTGLLEQFPHELDGGKRQLVGIARALALNPDFIVCDEPVSSLDVSIQAKIINLLLSLQKNLGITYLFISHDLSVVRHISERIAVMYLGKIVESCTCDELFRLPLHPYTIALLSAIPHVEREQQTKRIVLKGDVPSPMNPKPGCRFASRCFKAQNKCFVEEPEYTEHLPDHFAACHFIK